MKNLMIDLETLGVKTSAPVVSIGAVFFDIETATIGKSFYQTVTLESAMEYGVVESSTLRWWLLQSEQAKAVFSDINATIFSRVLEAFSEFIADNCQTEEVEVWGNGSSFDNAILANCYARLSMPLPWKFRNDRDMRTIVALCKQLKGTDPLSSVARAGIHHNALDDASFQAACVINAYKLLNS